MSDMQAEADLTFVRREIAPQLPAPQPTRGVIPWLRRNLFSSVGDTILTVLAVLFLLWVIPPLVNWAIIHAQWTGDTRDVCVANDLGACWAFVHANFGQFIFGRYPDAERWRVYVFFLLGIAGIVPMAMPRVPHKGLNLFYLMVVYPIVSAFLLIGGVLGLPTVETVLWGGLMLNIVVAYVGMEVSLPLGILLALGRRSRMPGVRAVSVIFIEVSRGVPLITVLFMASVMLPLFLPPGVGIDVLARALIGVAVFSAAYMAEVIRGGLQAVPKGQYEAADAMGLGYWQKMRLIILPQAIKIVIPGIVNTFIGLFKDTSLVYIIGVFELLGTVRNSFADPAWSTPGTPATGLFFTAIVFWIFCFGMSQYSQYTERRLNTGRKR
jgi:general L-amino acid transport system permease protein